MNHRAETQEAPPRRLLRGHPLLGTHSLRPTLTTQVLGRPAWTPAAAAPVFW